jgi:hypothetical protein
MVFEIEKEMSLGVSLQYLNTKIDLLLLV